nr:hypothetical protein [Paenibacillus bovis]
MVYVLGWLDDEGMNVEKWMDKIVEVGGGGCERRNERVCCDVILGW